jgi:hypothetical protein
MNNPISELQEHFQALQQPLPEYRMITEEVPDRKGVYQFRCNVLIPQLKIDITTKSYPAKKDAKIDAASSALIEVKKLVTSTIHVDGKGQGQGQGQGQEKEKSQEIRVLDETKLRSGQYSTILLVDLENVPKAGKLKYRADVYVILVLSHNHAFYCDLSGSGNFLYHLQENVCMEVIESSLKDAADHYITYLAGYLNGRHSAEYMVLSRDIGGACTVACMKNTYQRETPRPMECQHITNVDDLCARGIASM